MNFAILTPSRGRPGRLDNFLKSIYNFATNSLLPTYHDPRLLTEAEHSHFMTF